MQLFSHDSKADSLARTPLFGALSRAELVELAKRTEDMEVEEGKVLAREGAIGQEFFVIVDGEVSVSKDGQDLRTLGPGDFFGELGILAAERRMATVTTTSPVQVVVLTRGALRTVQREHPQVAARLQAAIDERFAPA